MFGNAKANSRNIGWICVAKKYISPHIASTANMFDVQSNVFAVIGRDVRSAAELKGNSFRTYVAVAFIRYQKNVATNNGIKIDRPNHKKKTITIAKIIPFIIGFHKLEFIWYYSLDSKRPREQYANEHLRQSFNQCGPWCFLSSI